MSEPMATNPYPYWSETLTDEDDVILKLVSQVIWSSKWRLSWEKGDILELQFKFFAQLSQYYTLTYIDTHNVISLVNKLRTYIVHL